MPGQPGVGYLIFTIEIAFVQTLAAPKTDGHGLFPFLSLTAP
jgi:hypothetical protein